MQQTKPEIIAVDALLTDEVLRVLGPEWVDNLREITDRPELTTTDEVEARDEIRSFLAELIREFDSYPFSNHPDYDTQTSLYIRGEKITTGQLAERMSNADKTHVHNDKVGIWNRDTQRASVYVVSQWQAQCASEKTISGAEIADGELETFTVMPDTYSDRTMWNSFTRNGDSLTPNPQNDELDYTERALLREVINDEVQRVAGDHLLQVVRNFEGGNALSYTDIYCHEGTGEDQFYPPTEENVRAFARDMLAANIADYDVNYPNHEDYVGLYDPHGYESSDEEQFFNAVSDAEVLVRDGQFVGFWNGVVRGNVGYGQENVELGDDNASAHIYVYGPQSPGETPTQLSHMGVEVSDVDELIEELEARVAQVRERFDK